MFSFDFGYIFWYLEKYIHIYPIAGEYYNIFPEDKGFNNWLNLKIMTERELLAMPLHTYNYISDSFSCLRVVNGWVYNSYHPNGSSSCFVPEPVYPDIVLQELKLNLPLNECSDKVNCNFPNCDCQTYKT